MIPFILAVLLTAIVHELGHMLAIMAINLKEQRYIFQFKMELNIKYLYVIHKKYPNPLSNLIVALAGPLAPVGLAILLINTGGDNFSTIFLLTALFNLLFMHPSLPDGKNIIQSLEEMGQKK
ncbi:hypothetical protein [Thalassobacillus sp. CUG 92003]|uniref:hypothetical protein n=1 Tax=Thalassobacillus sp. CUG 92003 TaxID=2736641 RepID=UPI0015E68A08|nr:hypothetical protein [Thalassobacillus sp. CUG 92003]